MRDTYFVAVIVLAAGLSTRFGRNKLFEPIGDSTLVEHVASEAVQSKARQVIVVGGHQFETLKRVLSPLPCQVVYNEDFEKGQSFSVRKGLSVVGPEAGAAIILPADMPLMSRELFNVVIDVYHKTRAPIVSAGFNGRAGHPILFDSSLFGELETVDEASRGLKKVLNAHQPESRVVETSVGALFDIDTPEDLSRLKENRLEGWGSR